MLWEQEGERKNAKINTISFQIAFVFHGILLQFKKKIYLASSCSQEGHQRNGDILLDFNLSSDLNTECFWQLSSLCDRSVD